MICGRISPDNNGELYVTSDKAHPGRIQSILSSDAALYGRTTSFTTVASSIRFYLLDEDKSQAHSCCFDMASFHLLDITHLQGSGPLRNGFHDSSPGSTRHDSFQRTLHGPTPSGYMIISIFLLRFFLTEEENFY